MPVGKRGRSGFYSHARRTMPKCSLVLIIFLIFSNFLALVAGKDFYFDAEWTDGESRALLAAEAEVDNIISKVSLKNEERSVSKHQTFALQKLYFQTKQGIYVTLTNIRGKLLKGVDVTGTTTSLRDRRTRLRLLVSLLEVEGHIFVEDGSAEGRPTDPEATANFSLTLTNITGKGLATLKINPSTFEIRVSKVLVDYEYGHSNLIVTPNKETELFKFLQGNYFKDTLVKKLWRDLSFHINMAAKMAMTSSLLQHESRGALQLLLRSEGVAEKLQQSEVNNTQSANNLVDKIIQAARGILVDRFQDQIPIPDIERYFGRTILFILPLRGHFLADQGTARGLSTAFRDGDTAYSKQNRTTHFYGAIAFTDLNLYYNHYEAKFVGVGPTGILNTKLHPITIQVHIHIDWKSRKIFLDEFKVERLGDLNVDITGLSIFNWLFSKITTWVVGWVRDNVVAQLETKYQDYIREVLSDVSVDDLISGKAFKKN